MTGRVRVLEWRPLARGSLVGFCSVQFASGMIVREIALHRMGTRAWASPPARPWTKGNELVLDENGKLKWQPLIDFATHGVRASWSHQIVAALHQAFPEAFDETEAAT